MVLQAINLNFVILLIPPPGRKFIRQTPFSHFKILESQLQGRRFRLDPVVLVFRIHEHGIGENGIPVKTQLAPFLKRIFLGLFPVGVSSVLLPPEMDPGYELAEVTVEAVGIDLFEPRTIRGNGDKRVDLPERFTHAEIEVVFGFLIGDARHCYVVKITVVVVFVAHMEARRIGPVDPDVVVNRPKGTLAQFHAHAHAEIVVYLVIGGTVVEIQAPAGFFLEKVVSDDDRFHRVDLHMPGVVASSDGVRQVRLAQAPVLVSAPRIERSVVSGFAARVMDVVEFDDMAAPCAVADANPRARHVVDMVVRGGDPLGARDVHARDLFAEKSAIVDQVVGCPAFVGKVTLGTDGGFQFADEANGAFPCLGELAPGHRVVPVVLVHEDPCAADCVKPAVPNRAVPRTLQKHRPAPVNGPIAERWDFIGF